MYYLRNQEKIRNSIKKKKRNSSFMIMQSV